MRTIDETTFPRHRLTDDGPHWLASAGAYGRVMASHYNLRDPAAEMVL